MTSELKELKDILGRHEFRTGEEQRLPWWEKPMQPSPSGGADWWSPTSLPVSHAIKVHSLIGLEVRHGGFDSGLLVHETPDPRLAQINSHYQFLQSKLGRAHADISNNVVMDPAVLHGNP